MSYNPNIQITRGESVGLTCSLDEFLFENEELHEDDIREALSTKGVYSAGGGAAPEWEIRVVRKKEPTQGEIAELRMFADANGRTWKSALNSVWMNGAYNNCVLGGADPGTLQHIRNTYGPSWLVSFRFPKGGVQ